MNYSKKKNIKDFVRKKLVVPNKDISRKVCVTFYRTKSGCYCPPPYQLKYRELSKVLK